MGWVLRLPRKRLTPELLARRRGGPDAPEANLEQRLLAERSDDGHVRPDGLLQAFTALEAEARPTTSALARWRWLGPGNIGGRTRALVIHPTRPTTLWAGSVGGGVWRSDDRGKSWRPLSDLLASLTVSTLAEDPRDPEVLVAGTGEGFFGGRGPRGAGIFLTRDGGNSWTRLASTAGPEFGYVNRLAFSARGTWLHAATGSGLFRSPDLGATWLPAPEPALGEFLDLETHPTDDACAIAGGSEGQVLRTADSGSTWSAATGLPPYHDLRELRRVEVTYAKADPRIVYASVDFEGGQIHRSDDGGASFALRHGEPGPGKVDYLGRQGWYDNAIWAGDPLDPELVVVGGIELWRSPDGGRRLERISQWWDAPRSAHADHHAIVSDPGYDGTTDRSVWFGNDGGVYRTADVRTVAPLEGWECKNENYGVTQFYRAAWNAETGTVLGGTQDHGTLRYRPSEGPHGWHQTITGDGGYLEWDPDAPRSFYGEYVFAWVERSRDDGETMDFLCGLHWDGAVVTWKEPPYRIEDAMRRQANFIAPMALTPERPTVLLVGARSLWLTTDPRAENTEETGPTWQAVKPGLGLPEDRNHISAIAFRPGRPGEVWVGHNRGQVFRTENVHAAEPAWELVNGAPAPALPKRMVTSLLIDPWGDGTVFASFGGYQPDNVWASPDQGRTWQRRATGLPAAAVKDLATRADRPGLLLAATALGVFESADAGLSWTRTPGGPGAVPVEQLLWADLGPGIGSARPGEGGPPRPGTPPLRPTLVAVTYGRGMFATELAPR